MRASEKNLDLGLLIIRIILGIAFIFAYGGPRLLAGPNHWHDIGLSMNHLGIYFLPGLWGFLAVGTEFLGGILIFIGLYMRPAAFFLAITMFVASISQLVSNGMFNALHAIELLFILVGLVFTGAGKYSLDYRHSRRRRSYR